MRNRRLVFLRASFALGLAVLFTAFLLKIYPAFNAALVRLRNDVRLAPGFFLEDSLPATSNGLADLEAFSLRLPPGTPSLPERTLGFPRFPDTLLFEFYARRRPFDSAVVFLWTGERLERRVTRRPGSLRWRVPLRSPAGGWLEVIGAYRSHPPRLRTRLSDASITPFERVDGAVLHAVRDRYAARAGKVLKPDTTYPAHPEDGPGEPALLARGEALAIVNPSHAPLNLGLLSSRTPGMRALKVPAATVQVYRKALEGGGAWLAVTHAGEAACVWGRCRFPERSFFLLDAPGF